MRETFALAVGKWEPGTWRPRAKNGRRTAILKCPRCGQEISLEKAIVSEHGVVLAVVDCPADGCRFANRKIKLEDWEA